MRTILIVNAFPATRAGLRAILRDAGISTLTAEAGTASEALDRITLELSLAVIDPNLPNLDPAAFIRQLRKHDAKVPILFFGGKRNALAVSMAMKMGADGYLDACSEEKIIAATIRTMLSGMQCFPKSPLPDPLTGRIQTLSTRELSVLLLLRQGLRNKDVATRLYLSEKTISAHKRNILAKLDISTIAQFSDHETLAMASQPVSPAGLPDAPDLSETPSPS